MRARCMLCPDYGCRMCRDPAAEEVWVAESDAPVARIPPALPPPNPFEAPYWPGRPPPWRQQQ